VLLDELGTYLQTQGLGTVGTTLFKGHVPLQGPDALLALLEVPGMPAVRSHDTPVARYEQPVVQVLVRGAPHDYQAARETAQTAWEALDGLSNVTLSDVEYLWMQALQSPFWLRTDDYHRPVLVFSVRCARHA
jgi:hypothetical protein